MGNPGCTVESGCMTTDDTTPRQARLTRLEKRLLDEFQRGFPLSVAPFAEMAGRLGTSEEMILTLLRSMLERGIISRVGPVFRPKKVGASTLAAMAVPEDRLESVAADISGYKEVNHNYEREHSFNLWFVVTARDQERIDQILDEIEQRTGLSVLDLPMLQQFHIDLGFPLWC